MIVLAGFILLTVAAALLLRANPRRLQSLRLRGETAIILLFLAQAVARGRLLTNAAARMSWNPVLPWILATAALLVLVLMNARLCGMPIVAAGLLANLLVVAANGGMPISLAATGAAVPRGAVVASDSFYVLATNHTLLRVMGDVIPAPSVAGFTGGLTFSVGDLCLLCGVSLLVLSVVLTFATNGDTDCAIESVAR